MEPDDKAAILAFLLVLLGLVLLTTSWWRAGLVLVPVGVFLPGADRLYDAFRGGFAEILGWKDDDVE